MLPISGEEEIASVLAVDDFKEDEYLVLLTKVGLLKLKLKLDRRASVNVGCNSSKDEGRGERGF